MIIEQTALDFQAIFHHFQKEFGFTGTFIDEKHDQGDMINRNAPSLFDDDGKLRRVKVQHLITEVKVEMTIPDGEASLSMDDLNEFYFDPAAKWLKEKVGESIIVSIPEVQEQHNQTTFMVRGLQLFSEYALHGGTDITFRVFAALPVDAKFA